MKLKVNDFDTNRAVYSVKFHIKYYCTPMNYEYNIIVNFYDVENEYLSTLNDVSLNLKYLEFFKKFNTILTIKMYIIG